MIAKLTVFSIVGDVAPDVGAVLGEDGDSVANVLERAARVPAVRPQRDGPQRLLRAGPADEDRQMRLDRSRLGQRVVERVEPALVAEPLAVEQAPDQHHGLVEAIEAFADRPGSRCRRRHARVRTRRRRCPGSPGRPRGGRGSSSSLATCPGLRNVLAPTIRPRRTRRVSGASAGEHAPALEDRLLPRTEDREQMVPGPDRVPAGVLGGEGRVTEARPIGPLRPELEPEARHESRWSWMAVGVIRKLIRSWLSKRAMSFSRSPGSSSG